MRSQSPVSLFTPEGVNLYVVNSGSSHAAYRRAVGSLGHKPDFDAQLADSGVSSVDAVAFFKEVNTVFDLSLMAEECLQFRTLRDLVAFIDGSNA